jgi:lactoylglutathione lyase
MPYRVNHIHIKTAEPGAVASFYAEAFNFEILSDEVRPSGDRFIRCRPEATDALVIISNQRTGEVLRPAIGDPQLGLDHFAIETETLAADLDRVRRLGAEVVEGPFTLPTGVTVAFLKAPGDVRIELMQLS